MKKIIMREVPKTIGEEINIKGYKEKYYIFDTKEFFNNEVFFICESVKYGEDAPHVIIDTDCNIIFETINGFEDFKFWINETESKTKKQFIERMKELE